MVEFSHEPLNQYSWVRLENAVNAYVDMIESQETGQADIIVFPESTLNSLHQGIEVPEPADEISPCGDDNWHLALQNISCSAARANKYVLINLTEAKNITTEEGEDQQRIYYNTNVVFDRQGRVVSRHRKFNLFQESGISVTPTADISTFTTDFNVTFGHFICFDLLFKAPAMQLLANTAVSDVLFPALWFSEPPFLSAVQVQSMWALANRELVSGWH